MAVDLLHSGRHAAMMSFYDPAEIIVAPETTYILISHNDDSYRRIYTDGRVWPAEAAPTFEAARSASRIDREIGDGKFDVLEVETRFLKLPRSYDISGVPFHSDGQAIIKERIFSTRPTTTRSMTRSP